MRFLDYFKAEEVGEPDVEAAQVIYEFATSRYWPVLQDWITQEVYRPAKVGDHLAMIESTVRANTFRELKTKIDRDIQSAISILKTSGRL